MRANRKTASNAPAVSAIEERERTEAIEREREAQARHVARPLGVRLLEARYAFCHGPDALRERRYGRLGWWVVLLCMEYFNGAGFEPGERRVIVAHLTDSQSAGPIRAGIEWLAAAAVVALLVAAGGRCLRRRARAGTFRRA